MSFNRFIAGLWIVAAASVGLILFPLLAVHFKNDPQTWFAIAASAAALIYALYMARAEWQRPPRARTAATDNPSMRAAIKAGLPDTNPPEPGTAQALQEKLSSVFERVPLEKQVADFAAADLTMLPGRTVEELLQVWPREEYETDPYQCLLFTYAIEVEAEPWGRWFTGKGWNWDTECISDPGSYVTVLRNIERLTGQEVFTELSDDAQYAESGTAHITYAIKGGEVRKVPVELNHDWADVMAVCEILPEIEQAVGDNRRFWQGDNGQAILVYFITDETAAKVNALREGLLWRMT